MSVIGWSVFTCPNALGMMFCVDWDLTETQVSRDKATCGLALACALSAMDGGERNVSWSLPLSLCRHGITFFGECL